MQSRLDKHKTLKYHLPNGVYCTLTSWYLVRSYLSVDVDVDLDMDILADGLRVRGGAGAGWERLVRTCCAGGTGGFDDRMGWRGVGRGESGICGVWRDGRGLCGYFV